MTSDTLPVLVPELDVSRANWAIFSLHFQIVLQEKGLWEHFNGTSICPVSATTQSTSSSSITASIPTTQTTVITVFPSTTISIPISSTGTQDEINAWN